MGLVLGIGIPAVIIGVIVLLFILSGRGAKRRLEALQSYAAAHGDRLDAANPNALRLTGTRSGRSFSAELTKMNLSAASVGAGVEGGRVAGRFVLATMLRTNLPGRGRFLIARPFFREAIHLPMRGLDRVEVPHPAFAPLRVFGEPGETFAWLDDGTGVALNETEAWEMRLEDGELSLMLNGNDPDGAKLDKALQCLVTTAERVGG